MSASPTMDPELVKRAVNFHGRELQKIWESEHHKEDDIVKSGAIDFDFAVYQERQKHLSFQDRGKRLKVQHFVARHAEQLFDSSHLPANRQKHVAGTPLIPGEEELYAVLPPYDMFLPLKNSSRLQHFFECVEPGELLICSITSKSSSGMMLKVLCTDSAPFRYVADLSVKAFCPVSEMPSGGMVADKKGTSRPLMLNEAIRVELLEVVPDSEKMVVSMLQSKPADKSTDESSSTSKRPQLGLVYTEDLPFAYKMCQDHKGEGFSDVLERSLGFANHSNTELLATKAGINQDTQISFLKSLRGRFPMDEYFSELRQVQAGKWAFKSVAEGITHFKAGHHSEAFQCLNRALNIDRRNVEGLVARGALFANSGSFQKAIEDFENALKLNPNHQNARKYMGETLVALGRSYEDENKIEEALKAYENCLELVPYHEDAQNSIRYLQNKMRGGGNGTSTGKLASDPHAINPSVAATDIILPGLTSTKSMEVKATLKQLLKEDVEKGRSSRSKKKKDRKRKSRRRSRKRRRRDRSSSSSSSSSSGSGSSSSSSSSSSGSASSGDHASSRSPSASPHRSSSKKHKSKKHHSKEAHREKSLSPLSKRMALMDTSRDSDGLSGLMTQRITQYNSSAQPYSFEDSAPAPKSSSNSAPAAKDKDTDYEQRVKSFLEQTKGNADYDDEVRKFIEDSIKWRKDRKGQEKEGSKKKKKKEKTKSKEKEKGKKKKSKDDEKRRKRRSHKSSISEMTGDPAEGSGFAEQLEGLDESGRRLVKEALLHKLGKPRHRTVVEGSESSSEERDDGFPSAKKLQNKSDLTRMLSDLPGRLDDLGDLESKLSAYYAKVGKDKGISKRKKKHKKKTYSEGEEKDKKSAGHGVVSYPSPIGKPVKGNKGNSTSPKLPYMHDMDLDDDELAEKRSKMDIFADSPSPPGKGKMSENSNIVSSKWKMQITPSSGSKVKRRDQSEKEPWEDTEEKRFIFIKEEGEMSDEANARHRPPTPKHKFNAKEAYYEKFTGFRIARKDDPTKMDPSSILPAKAPPTPVPAPSKDGAIKGLDSETEVDVGKKKMKTKSRSRSKSSTSRSRARSSASSGSGKIRRRSRSGSYRRRSRSGSYRNYSRSRSASYYSRSRSRSRSYDRSRSRSYYSRSRSRSGSREGRRRSSDYYRRGSRSPDRYRRYDGRGNAHRYPRQRGTYYRPRFQGYKSPRGGGGGYVPRGRGYNPRGGRPFIPRGRGRGRPRYFHNYNNRSSGYRPEHHRRYDSRDRSRERSYEERDRDRDGSERDRERDRERTRRSVERKSEEPKREREVDVDPRGDEEYASKSADYIDRKMFEGKWAEDRDEEKRRAESRRDDDEIPPPPGTVEPLPENSIEEMDKFLNKVKAQKKEEMKERNKSYKRPIVY